LLYLIAYKLLKVSLLGRFIDEHNIALRLKTLRPKANAVTLSVRQFN